MCSRCGCVTDAKQGAVRPALIEGALEAALLLVLAKAEGYGYELATELKRRELLPSPVLPARVYETLHRLEIDGAVTSHEEPSAIGPDRRRYRLTAAGRERLDRWAEALRQTERSLHRLLHTYDRG